jgi:hypothetical protein
LVRKCGKRKEVKSFESWIYLLFDIFGTQKTENFLFSKAGPTIRLFMG